VSSARKIRQQWSINEPTRGSHKQVNIGWTQSPIMVTETWPAKTPRWFNSTYIKKCITSGSWTPYSQNLGNVNIWFLVIQLIKPWKSQHISCHMDLSTFRNSQPSTHWSASPTHIALSHSTHCSANTELKAATTQHTSNSHCSLPSFHIKFFSSWFLVTQRKNLAQTSTKSRLDTRHVKNRTFVELVTFAFKCLF